MTLEPHWCPVDDCDFGVDEDRSLHTAAPKTLDLTPIRNDIDDAPVGVKGKQNDSPSLRKARVELQLGVIPRNDRGALDPNSAFVSDAALDDLRNGFFHEG